MLRHRRWRFLLAAAGTALAAGALLSGLKREETTLENSLVDMSLLPPTARNDVLYTAGTPLAGTVSARTLTAAESPYLLRGTVLVPQAVTLTLEPGTTVAAAEGARLLVEGTLHARGTAWQSNQAHPARRLWHGIVAQRGGSVEIRDTVIRDASAGLTCGPGGSLYASRVSLQDNAAGVVTLRGSRTCFLEGLRAVSGRVGFQLIGGAPILKDITVGRVSLGIRVLHQARPTIEGLTVRRPLRTLLTYAAEPPLVLRDVRVPSGFDLGLLIHDGADAETYRWRGNDYALGTVLVR